MQVAVGNLAGSGDTQDVVGNLTDSGGMQNVVGKSAGSDDVENAGPDVGFGQQAGAHSAVQQPYHPASLPRVQGSNCPPGTF